MNKTLVSISRFVIGGVSVFVIDVLLHWFLINIVGVNYLLVGYIVMPITLVMNFSLHRIWSFRDVGSNEGRVQRQGFRYIILVCFNTVVNMVLMYLFYGTLGLPLLFARVASALTTVIWNFPVYRLWVYRK